MKPTALTCVIAAASLLSFSSLSYAQDYQRDGRHGDGRHGDRQGYTYRGDHRGWQPQYRQPAPSVYQGQGRHDGYRAYGQGERWGAHVPQYRRGDYLPYQYRQRPYYVTDWRAHRLYAPPAGYQWVRADDTGDYLLVALATGLIANLLLSQ